MLITDRPSVDVDTLRARLTGEVVAPADAHWDRARQAWNLAVDQRPLAVAFPVTDADVIAVVDYAREAGVRIAAQGTGHNAGAMGSLDDTILVSTARMRGVRIDPEKRLARVRAGALWLDVTAPASEYGLAPLAGSSPDVGVVGYTLGGGLSWLGRKHGLAADSVTAIEIVLADGRHVRCDENVHADLFWALRGGGGSFGVVTAMEFKLHPATELYGGPMFWPWERSAEVMKAWREWTRTAPESVTSCVRILHVPDMPDVPEPLRGRSFVNVDAAVLAPIEEAAAILAPLTGLAPEIAMVGPMEPVALSRLHNDPEQPMPFASGSLTLETLTDEAIDALLGVVGPGTETPLLLSEIRHLGGALGRRAAGSGALGRFPGEYLFLTGGIVTGVETAMAIDATAARAKAALEPCRATHNYLNFEERNTNPATLFDPQVYARLRQVKTVVDPEDMFRANHSIPPR
jgi:FAD binding domain-containing protein/berberine-like enzyme